MDVNSREYIFAIELMTSVMEVYCIKPRKPFKSLFCKNQSPFTPVVKKAVEYIWREKKEFIEDLFKTVIHMGTINMRNYKSAMEFASHLVIEAEYDEIELLRFCVIASGYASIFFLGGLEHVPSQCIKLIYNTIMSFRAKNQFTDESWRDIEILGGAYSVESLCKEDLSKSTSACFSQASNKISSDNLIQIDAYTTKFKTNTVNKYQKKITKSSEACNNLENEFPQISNNVETVGHNKNNEIVSQIVNTSENISMIVNNTKKNNIIKQEINGDSESYNASEVSNIIKAHTKIKFNKLFGKNYKNKKYKLSKSKKFKANKNACYGDVYKRIAGTSYTSESIENKECLSNVNSETSQTCIEPARTKNSVEDVNDALVIKNTDTVKKVKEIKRKKPKSSKHKTKRGIVKNENFASTIKQQPKNIIENNNVLLNDTLVIKNTDTDKKVEGNKTKNFKHKTKSDIVKTENFASPIKQLPTIVIKNNNVLLNDALVIKHTHTDQKVKGEKIKSSKHKTKCGIVKTENFASAIKPQQLPKNVIENKVLLNSEETIRVIKRLNYKKKLSKIKYVAENFKYRVPISEIKLTTKDVQRNKYDKFAMDNFENMSEVKDVLKDLTTDGDVAERNKTAHKIPNKIKLSKYETHKFKGKSYINKNKKRKQIKEDEINMDSSEDSAINNTASQYLSEEKFDIEGKFKKRKLIKKKSNKSKTKNKFKNENFYKNFQLTLCSSDEYVDRETVEENVNVVCKNAITKKRKYNTKSIKNDAAIKDRRKSNKFKRITRRSTREQNANCSVIDITEEKQQMASTSNTRSPGCEISNLMNVSESEKSKSVLDKFFENFRSKMRKNKEFENKDPKSYTGF